MSTIAELSLMRVFRAFQTVIEMCESRGYTFKHPKALAELLYSVQEGEVRKEATSSSLMPSTNPGVVTFSWFKKFLKEEARKNIAQEDGNENSSSAKARNQTLGIYNITLACKKVTYAKEGSDSRVNEANSVKDESPGVVLEENEGKDGTKPTKMLVFFLCGEREKSLLSLKDVLECRREALHRHASRIIIVAPAISAVVRREAKEACGVASYVDLLPEEKKKLVSQSSGSKKKEEPKIRFVSSLGGGEESATANAQGASLSTTSPFFCQIELFEEHELLLNPSHHETVPRHVILSEPETQALLKKYQIHRNQLPRIALTDPMVKYIGATRGVVVHIQRESEDSGPYSMYRQVV